MNESYSKVVRPERLNRRTVLRGIGVAMGLPLLDAMTPATARAAANDAPPRRFLAINLHLGFMAQNFFPKARGKDYEATKYLKLIDRFRKDYTVVSGTSHPGVGGAHDSDCCFLTSTPGVGQPGFRNAMSVDQIVARHYFGQTRYAHLPLGHRRGLQRSLAWSASGANIPPISHPAAVFGMMFLDGSPKERAQRMRDLNDGRSILDALRVATNDLSRTLGKGDRDKLDEYFTAVRETEQRFATNQDWLNRPKPKTDYKMGRVAFDAGQFVEETALMYDMIYLALQSDASRVITYNQPNTALVLDFKGVRIGYHQLSHHNKNTEKMRQLEIIELAQMKAFAGLLEKLTSTREGGRRLIDSTSLLLGSNFGNASNHDTRNLPVIVAGGGFKHGQHLAFKKNDNTPLANVFVSMLQRLGIEKDRFGSSTSALTGLEFARG